MSKNNCRGAKNQTFREYHAMPNSKVKRKVKLNEEDFNIKCSFNFSAFCGIVVTFLAPLNAFWTTLIVINFLCAGLEID